MTGNTKDVVNWNIGASSWIFQIFSPKIGISRAVFIKGTGLRPKTLSSLFAVIQELLTHKKDDKRMTKRWQKGCQKNRQLWISPNPKCYGTRCLTWKLQGQLWNHRFFQKSCWTKVQNLKFGANQLGVLIFIFFFFNKKRSSKKQSWKKKIEFLPDNIAEYETHPYWINAILIVPDFPINYFMS